MTTPTLGSIRWWLCRALACSIIASSAHAGSATWLASPPGNNWNSAANWTAGGPPNGSSDTASFSVSNQTALSITATTQLSGITFLANASPYTITINAPLQATINGTGVTNNSSSSQNVIVSNNAAAGSTTLTFSNNAAAGHSVTYTAAGATAPGAAASVINLQPGSNADHAIFFANGGIVNGAGDGSIIIEGTASHGTFTSQRAAASGGFGGETYLFSATADHASFIANGSAYASSSSKGLVSLFDADGANATFTNNGGTANNAPGGLTFLNGASTAGSATFTNNPGTTNGGLGGTTQFGGIATAANAVFNNSNATVSGAFGGRTIFTENSTAGNGVFTNKASPFQGPGTDSRGGSMEFDDASSAGSRYRFPSKPELGPIFTILLLPLTPSSRLKAQQLQASSHFVNLQRQEMLR